MSAKKGKTYKLLVDTSLFILPGGTKGDMRRLRERAKRAEGEGTIEIVDISSLSGKYEVKSAPAHAVHVETRKR